MHECDFTNNITLICQNPRVTSINTCLEIDLTGQVCSDSLGTYMYSGKYKKECLYRMVTISWKGKYNKQLGSVSHLHETYIKCLS